MGSSPHQAGHGLQPIEILPDVDFGIGKGRKLERRFANQALSRQPRHPRGSLGSVSQPGSFLKTQSIEQLRVPLPIFLYFDPQVEVDAGAEQRFDLATGLTTGRGEKLPSLADHNALL